MTQPKISSIAYLIAEPVRAVILITLADGSSMSASALADAAGVTPQTASSHLAKLLDGGLLTVEIKGRTRFYQLAGPDVSHVLESLAAVAPQTSSWRSLPNRSAHELRFARCCYDHLQARRCLDWTERQHHIAGPLGTHLLETFCQLGWLRRTAGSRAVHVTGSGWRAFKLHLGIEHLRHLEAPLHAVTPARKTLMPAPVAS